MRMPSRSRSPSVRLAVADVHYYNAEQGRFYMSWIDTSSYIKDIQACHDFTKNVIKWMVNVQ